MRIVIKLVWDFLKLLCNSLRWIIFSLPFLTFILVTVLMASFSIWALVSAIYIPHSPWTRSQPTSTRMVAWEMQARSLWIIASTILVLGLLVSICIGVRSMWIALQHRKRWWFPSYFVCTTVFTIAVFVFGALCNWCWGPSNVVFWPGIELAPGWKVGDVYHLHLIFGCCGAIFLIAGCIALYHFSDRPALVLSLHDICERLRWLDNSLYAGAFLMIGAALSHHAVALWQASLIKDDESAAVYMQFGKSFTTTVGVYYGLCLLYTSPSPRD